MVSALLGEAETGFVEGAILEVSLGACRGIQVKVGTRIEPSRQKDQPGDSLSVGASLLIEQMNTGIPKMSIQFSSVAQSCPTLCDPMNHSTSGLPVHHQLPEFTQSHVHRVRDAIQPSHPRSSPSPPAPNPSQHQSLFQ